MPQRSKNSQTLCGEPIGSLAKLSYTCYKEKYKCERVHAKARITLPTGERTNPREPGDGNGARRGQFGQEEIDTIKNDSTWTVSLYPNPSIGEFYIVSNIKNDRLYISIADLSGRLIMSKFILTSEYSGFFDLELDNGVYFISFRNINNDVVVKKIHIAK